MLVGVVPTEGCGFSKRLGPGERARRKAFLEAFAESGNISAAASASGCHRSRHYAWLADPVYAAEFADAEDQAVDALTLEARRRALQGWDEPVYYKGEPVGAVRKYSDQLLMFLLRGARPDVYRERVDVISEQALDRELAALTAEVARRDSSATERPPRNATRRDTPTRTREAPAPDEASDDPNGDL